MWYVSTHQTGEVLFSNNGSPISLVYLDSE